MLVLLLTTVGPEGAAEVVPGVLVPVSALFETFSFGGSPATNEQRPYVSSGGQRVVRALFPDVRISTPPNEPALPILTLPGVVESSLTATPEDFWTEAECRREVEYIGVADQKLPPRVLQVHFLSSTSSTPHDRRKDETRDRRRTNKKMGKLLGRLFVGFTIMLISFNGYSSQIFIIWPWYGREASLDLLKLIVPFKYVRSAPV